MKEHTYEDNITIAQSEIIKQLSRIGDALERLADNDTISKGYYLDTDDDDQPVW